MDFNQIWDEAAAGTQITYRDPLLEPYGDETKVTPTQKKAWDFFHEWLGKHEHDPEGKDHIIAPLVAMIGAKGSAKTHWGACYAMTMAQKYPGSIGCLASNSYQQAKDNGGPILMKVCEKLGYPIDFYTHKKMGGRQYTNVYVITLAPGVYSYVAVRSFDAISLIEGTEFDWGWAEEVQDATKDSFVVFVSRIRGGGSPNCIFAAGMPEPGTHWQYKMLPALGFIEEDKYEGRVEKEFFDPETGETEKAIVVGQMWEPSVFENKQNVGMAYINKLFELYSKEDAERYVYGKRGETRGDRVFYQYRDGVHRLGGMSNILCHYDPSQKLIISYDFNVYPMSVSVYQPKPWNDDWEFLIPESGKWKDIRDHKIYDSPEKMVAPNRIVAAQIDEIEVYPDNPNGGMTYGMTQEIEDRYLDHQAEVVVLGDASGNQRRSSSDTTDWKIIGESMQRFVRPIVYRGLVTKRNLKTGASTYSNPSQRDALQNANRVLMDGNSQVWVCFLPESKLDSGGVAASLTNLGFKANGDFDTKSEKKMDRDIPRSHFADTFKYFCWYFRPPSRPVSKTPARSSKSERIENRKRAKQLSERKSGYAW